MHVVRYKSTVILIFLAYTEPVIQKCVECDRDFQTNVCGTSCPSCVSKQYESFMNYDLFPELTHQLPLTSTSYDDED